jgi:hypothetical protein
MNSFVFTSLLWEIDYNAKEAHISVGIYKLHLREQLPAAPSLWFNQSKVVYIPAGEA